MLEMIRCSCNNSIASKYIIFKELQEKKIDTSIIWYVLNIDKECCKLKFLTCAEYKDYT